MKKKHAILLVILAFAIATIACSSGGGKKDSNVKVNTPGASDEKETQATSAPEIGTARSNPAPVGSEIIADEMAFEVIDIVRPANDLVEAGNSFNSDPDEGKEYMFVEIQITCKKSTDEKCSFAPYQVLRLLGSKGIEYKTELFISGIEGRLENIDFYGEVTVSGYIPFQVEIEETDFVLVYDPFLGDKFFLAVP